MQILKVRAENFKGLRLVEIEPKQGTTVIGGANRAGKSSILDAVQKNFGSVSGLVKSLTSRVTEQNKEKVT